MGGFAMSAGAGGVTPLSERTMLQEWFDQFRNIPNKPMPLLAEEYIKSLESKVARLKEAYTDETVTRAIAQTNLRNAESEVARLKEQIDSFALNYSQLYDESVKDFRRAELAEARVAAAAMTGDRRLTPEEKAFELTTHRFNALATIVNSGGEPSLYDLAINEIAAKLERSHQDSHRHRCSAGGPRGEGQRQGGTPMTKERKRPAIRESHPVTCPNCDRETNISYQRRRDEPRHCRHCGATIAEPPQEAEP
jgi:hypothetical protein